MLITRKKKISLLGVFLAQLPFTLALFAGYMTNTPFVYAMKKFIENPAAITALISIEVFITLLGGPFVNWLSDRIWTRAGRRKPFVCFCYICQFILLPLVPLAPNLWVLIIMKWIMGVVSDIGTPVMALVMETVPGKQRGRGAGFQQVQLQLINIVFFMVMIGRFHEEQFLGPFGFVLRLTGEQTLFFSGGILALTALLYIMLGVKETKPAYRRTLKTGRKEGENLFVYFFRSFFGDVFSRDLWPLYAILFANNMTGVGLGLLGPLLYTDQWGYSLQEMGLNVAAGAVVGIFIATLAGWLADRYSKIIVYAGCKVMGVLITLTWFFYVMYLPGQRPTLFEIFFFGQINYVFGLTAGVVALPLMYEFVDRNRFGTLGAGTGLFNQILKNLITVFVGFWVWFWSIMFLPQEGNYAELVFDTTLDRAAMEQRLNAAGFDMDAVHIKPRFAPSTTGKESRRWTIRRHTERARELQKEIKQAANRISSLEPKQSAPGVSEERANEIQAEIEDLRAGINAAEAELAIKARRFSREVREILERDLVGPGSQILDAAWRGDGLSLALATVEEVNTERDPAMSLWLRNQIIRASEAVLGKEERLQTEQLRENLKAFDIALAETPASEDDAEYLFPNWEWIPIARQTGVTYEPALAVRPLPDTDGFRVELDLDSRFLKIYRALYKAEIPAETARNIAGELVSLFRGSLGRSPDLLRVRDAVCRLPDVGAAELEIELKAADTLESAQIEALARSVATTDWATRARLDASADGPSLVVTLEPPISRREADPESDPVTRRLAELTGAPPYAIAYLSEFYQRVVDTADASPVFLTIASPVVEVDSKPREYDYFFSVHILMILTDFLALVVLWMILKLERRGVIHRYGAEEDNLA